MVAYAYKDSNRMNKLEAKNAKHSDKGQCFIVQILIVMQN